MNYMMFLYFSEKVEIFKDKEWFQLVFIEKSVKIDVCLVNLEENEKVEYEYFDFSKDVINEEGFELCGKRDIIFIENVEFVIVF